MDFSAALSTDLARLSEALDDPNADLAGTLRRIVDGLRATIPSFSGLRITLAGVPFWVAAGETDVVWTDIRASARLLPPAIDATVVLFATEPGAFAQLGSDLRLDADLPVDPSGEGSDALAGQRLVNQALGFLVAGGLTMTAAAGVLAASADGNPVSVARGILDQATAPSSGDTDRDPTES